MSTHRRETCRLCGTRTRRLFTHVLYSHETDPSTASYADAVTALMRRARGNAI